jgi:hypothetical protein
MLFVPRRFLPQGKEISVRPRLTVWPASAALLVAASLPAWPAFQDTAYSARSMAMGGAFTAVYGDPVSVFFNPAGLAAIPRLSMRLDGVREIPSASSPAPEDNLNGIVSMRLPARLGVATFSGLSGQEGAAGSEQMEAVSWGGEPARHVPGGQLYLGASAKMLGLNETGGAPDSERFGVDAGAIYRFRRRFSFGASLLNANQPAWDMPGFDERAPRTARAGFAVELPDFVFAADYAHSNAAAGNPSRDQESMGVERWWNNERGHSLFVVRSGVAAGGAQPLWSWGLGVKKFGVEISYAMSIALNSDAGPGQALSLRFRFIESPSGATLNDTPN